MVRSETGLLQVFVVLSSFLKVVSSKDTCKIGVPKVTDSFAQSLENILTLGAFIGAMPMVRVSSKLPTANFKESLARQTRLKEFYSCRAAMSMMVISITIFSMEWVS